MADEDEVQRDGREVARRFLRERQRQLWPSRDTPRASQRARASSIKAQMRSIYATAQYFDDVDRQSTSDQLEDFLQRLDDPRDATELVGTDAIVDGLVERITMAAIDLGYSGDVEPVLGTAHTGLPTALSYPVEGSSVPVVLLDSSLLGWIHVVASNMADLFDTSGDRSELQVSASPDSIEARLRDDPAVGARLALAALAYVTGMQPGQAMLSPTVRSEGLAKILRDAMELFVVGHEIGHFVEGHFTSRNRGDAANVRYSWEQEHVADGRGLELSIRAMQLEGVPAEIGILGADLYLGVLLLVEHAEQLAAPENPQVADVISAPGHSSPSHPPPGTRRTFLRDVVRRSDPDGGETFNPMYEISDALHVASLVSVASVLSIIHGDSP